MALKKFIQLSDPDANGVRTVFQIIHAESLAGRVHPDVAHLFTVAPAKVDIGWRKKGGAWLEPAPPAPPPEEPAA